MTDNSIIKSIFAAAAMTVLAAAASARQPSRGYRGFVDVEYSLQSVDYGCWGRLNESNFGVSTVHGCQLLPRLFVGGGLQLDYNEAVRTFAVPVFADVRTDLTFGRFTPFADLRLGYTLAECGAARINPSVGYRFDLGRKVGLNVGVGFLLQISRVDVYDVSYYDYGSPQYEYGGYVLSYVRDETRYTPSLSVRVGIDF